VYRRAALGPGAYRIVLGFSAPAGVYGVYAARAETAGRDDTSPTVDPADVRLVVQRVSVPDLWSTPLSTSSVVVAERVEPLPPTGRPERSEAYVLGAFAIVPAGETDFRQSDELSVIFAIYNQGLTSAGKPDVSVEYRFHRRNGDRTSYYTRTEPQVFNGQTTPEFDASLGHQLIAGQSIGLGAFPAGAYRLEIEIVDKTRKQTVTRAVDFAVRPS
jgi:hypothetical protein